MVSNEEASSLSLDERIKALLYQYLKLYERWAEDRQVFNKSMAHQEKMLEEFTQKLKQFEQLEPQVREKLIDAIGRASRVLSEDIREKIGHSATAAVDQTAKELQAVVRDASHALTRYRETIQISQAKSIIVTVCTAVFTSLLIVWFLMPKPQFPLTGDMLHTYANGARMEALWPKLPRKTQVEIDKIFSKNFNEAHPFGEVTSSSEN